MDQNEDTHLSMMTSIQEREPHVGTPSRKQNLSSPGNSILNTWRPTSVAMGLKRMKIIGGLGGLKMH